MSETALIPIELIDEHPDNPRSVSWNLPDLIASIRQIGVITPCTLRKRDGNRFQLISGHRRLRAAHAAGLEQVPCVILDVEDQDVWALMLSENIQREGLNPIEEARTFKTLRARGVTILAISKRLGCSEQRVSRRLGLLDLDVADQQRILDGQLSMAEAWDLARAAKPRKGPKPGNDNGNGGRTTKYDAHFNQRHSLASAAAQICDRWADDHSISARLGPACSSCWEEAIREDQMAIDDQLLMEEMSTTLSPADYAKWREGTFNVAVTADKVLESKKETA